MEHPIVATAVRNNPDALAFLRTIAQILHFWDDLIDRDHEIDDRQINDAFTLALIELPRNAFYREHFDTLNVILQNAITNWHIANQLEREPHNEDRVRVSLMTAFVIRSSYIDLLTQSALIVGGMDWAAHCGPEIHRWAHSEGYDGYLTNLAAEQTARKESHVL
jgi:hypothetical protein